MPERPLPAEAWEDRLPELLELLRDRRAVALVGAGCSTESGIPDYRGPDGRMRHRRPMQFREFVESADGRARYWSRSAVGWPVFASARPNAAHVALADLERAGVLAGVITQNVDGLHQAAGSREVVELHGSLARVRCLDCGRSERRDALQERLLELNAGWLARLGAASGEAGARPDGDAELPAEALAGFRVPACEACDGVLKPDVVFFGESVPKERVGAAASLLERADVLLVVGSSLAVYSGRRFVYRARDAGLPVGIVNQGPTRADELARVKVEGRAGDVLPRLARELGAVEARTL
ncbi:MAG TPA: NAD-dependent protein deacetylase [Longimicrobiales bacterium]|nr:NAD-dependent protein deacetylase [Longimicrobiales bacterium]